MAVGVDRAAAEGARRAPGLHDALGPLDEGAGAAGVEPDQEQLAQQALVEHLPDPDVATAIAQLAPMQRAAVVLFYWDDLPVREIAEVLEVSESTVKQHLHRARHRLADVLAEEVGEDVR